MRNMVSDDFLRVHDFRNLSATSSSVRLQIKVLADNLKEVTLTEHSETFC